MSALLAQFGSERQAREAKKRVVVSVVRYSLVGDGESRRRDRAELLQLCSPVVAVERLAPAGTFKSARNLLCASWVLCARRSCLN